jgi:uncharacterized protein YcsI (UPF0317 family)
MTALEQPGNLAREVFRTGEVPDTTSGRCRGYVQANLLAVPRDLAFDALLFAIRNPGPCPLLDVTDPGDPRVHDIATADLRTDLPAASEAPFVITHSPGRMLITDHPDESLIK